MLTEYQNHSEAIYQNKRLKFSSDHIEEYERQFMLEHIIHVAMRELAPPATPQQFMESLREWIRRNQLAKLDCFQEPSWECPCYECGIWRVKMEEDTTMMKGIL